MRRGSSGLNLLLGVNKPAGMSSHDVVNVVRRALGERRVGHAGTLDPAAEGVLVIGVGQGTRLMGLLTADSKSYVAGISFGRETNTDDVEGEPGPWVDVPVRLQEAREAQLVLDSFLGEQMQVPPAFSAISVGGKRSYARARAGEQVELEARPMEVKAALLLSMEGQAADADVLAAGAVSPLEWQCAFTVSKGTYVRALARDLGRRVGSAAHLSRLCRTSSGTVTLAQCVSLQRVRELGAEGVRQVALDPVRALGIAPRELTSAELRDVCAGRSIDAAGLVRGERVALVRDGRLWGVWRSNGVTLLSQANFPSGIEGARA